VCDSICPLVGAAAPAARRKLREYRPKTYEILHGDNGPTLGKTTRHFSHVGVRYISRVIAGIGNRQHYISTMIV
jgi:hypothetical protein